MDVAVFLKTWLGSAGAERANKDLFLTELCDVLGVPRPSPKTGDRAGDTYVFERDAITPRAGETTTTKFIDLYKEGCFLLEAKQGSTAVSPKLGTARRDTPGWTFAMKEAYGQALGYARTFDNPPPFVIVVDLGHCFDLYASFDRSWNYAPFPDAQHNRLHVADLASHVELLHAVWTDPWSLDPSRKAARVTEEVATHLAELAKSLDQSHPPELVAKFLMRCLFTMFAEDVGLLGNNIFTDSLERFWIPNPPSFPYGARSLWNAMNDGTDYLTGKLLKFNGGLFADATALPLTKEQLGLLREAAKCDWSDVEPAIFGTLLERALNPRERHKLGAHYTPRAYVERLVRPTILEPVREEWEAVQAEARAYLTAKEPDPRAAVRCVREFHGRLAATRVLDPACGSGNFLYVTLDLFKRLESEILEVLRGLGESEQFEMQHVRVSPRQFLGLEVNPWAKEIAELVLWIGYLQWHFRAYAGRVPVQEPVIEDTKSIVCRDAVLTWDKAEPALDDRGRPLFRWDGRTFRVDEATGHRVADESAKVEELRYAGARPAEWPAADYVVGNPPFIGTKKMRQHLGDHYVDALRATYSDAVEDNADFVMYWWHKAAGLVRDGEVKRFGFITTNSITQAFNRRVVEHHIQKGLRVRWAIPDHPWTDAESGAAVRIAMTCASDGTAAVARLGRVVSEAPSTEADGFVAVQVEERVVPEIHADLRAGAAVASAVPLKANDGVSGMGVALHGAGFILTPEEYRRIAALNSKCLYRYIGGRDLLQGLRERYLIDFSFLSEEQARAANPHAFQVVLDRVKPERVTNRRESIRKLWWRFGWERPIVREALKGLSRFIATTETAKHRVFQFVSSEYLPDHKIVVVASEDALIMGFLSSSVHCLWALEAGATLEDRPAYTKSTCLEPFPFPDASVAQRARIRELAEALDSHRKARLAEAPDLTITGMYNVLEKLRATEALTAKEKADREAGLVSVLKSLHDDLDAAVFEAYGWPPDLTDEQILERLVALNTERAKEEVGGLIRWLRPEYQAKGIKAPTVAQEEQADLLPAPEAVTAVAATGPAAWPKTMQERLAVVRARVTSDAARPWSVEDVRASFKGARGDQVEPILDSLAFLGHLMRVETADGVRWQGAAVAT